MAGKPVVVSVIQGANVLLQVLADFGEGDLAYAEVIQRIKTVLPEAVPNPVYVPPLNTLACGFCIGQLSLGAAAAPSVFIFANVAPRRDDLGPRAHGAGEPLVHAELPTGAQVVAVNSGYSLSFIKRAARALRSVTGPAAGSPFRSRDIFPEALARVVRGEPGALGGEIDRDKIPDPPLGVVAYVDGFGNIKTSWRSTEIGDAPGASLHIRIGATSHVAVLTAEQHFEVGEGQLAFTPGSSGWTEEGRDFRFLEVFLRGGSAWDLFGRPAPGTPVEMSDSAGASPRGRPDVRLIR